LVSDKGRSRTGAALAISALLHLLAALLVVRGVGGRRWPVLGQARPAAPIEVSLLESKRRERPAAERPAFESPPVRRPIRAPAGRPSERAPLPAPASPSAAPGPDAKSPEATAPRAKHPLDLSFDALGESVKQRATAIPDPGEALEQLLAPPPDLTGVRRPLEELRADAERRADDEENVRNGRADPLLFDYLRQAQERLTPEATRIAEALPLGPSETMKGWARGYLRGVDEAHRGLTPLRPPDETVGGPRRDVLGGYNEAERQAESGAEQRTAEVCLGVAPNHAAVVTLRRSSGNAALDRLALDSFRSASDLRAVTPDIRPALACYLVRISAYRVPPLPTVSLDLIKRRIIYPLKRMTKVTVDLQSVDFGPKKESSNLLHAR
jgi:hypothetical protein